MHILPVVMFDDAFLITLFHLKNFPLDLSDYSSVFKRLPPSSSSLSSSSNKSFELTEKLDMKHYSLANTIVKSESRLCHPMIHNGPIDAPFNLPLKGTS